MKSRILIAVVLALAGCAPAASSPTPSTTPVATRSASPEADGVRDALASQRARNRELTAQLGLARAEVEELRGEVALLEEAERRRVTRITQPPNEDPTADTTPAETPPARSGPRPVLRLYGTASSPSRPAGSARGVAVLPGPVAPTFLGPPPAATVRLPVLTSSGAPSAGVPAIPAAPIAVAGQAPVAPAVEPPPSRAAIREYRAALSHLRDRRIPDAIAGLDIFLRDHATHPYADNAMYWRAEIDYTRRDYAGALTRFTRLIERYPRGNKVPDALLRIGLCYERMGQRSHARRVFSRLQRQYPNTVAARMASREDV